MKKEHKKELLNTIRKAAKDQKSLNAFLGDVLSPSEYENLATRIQILKQLKDGISHRQVAGDLHIGIGTVERGARVLQESDLRWWRVPNQV